MKFLVERDQIVPKSQIEAFETGSYELPEDWIEKMVQWQQQTEESLKAGTISSDMVETWFGSCLRSVADYNRYLIWGGVNAAALVKRIGTEALTEAIDKTTEEFMWEISKEFYVNVMPHVGFEDLGDLMELGMRGMFSDQYYISGQERQEGDEIVKTSLLKNCELAGIYFRAAEWNDLPKNSLGYGVCRYCEVHGDATMKITMPPMYSPDYKRVESLGIDDKTCKFELRLTEADDMPSIDDGTGKSIRSRRIKPTH